MTLHLNKQLFPLWHNFEMVHRSGRMVNTFHKLQQWAVLLLNVPRIPLDRVHKSYLKKTDDKYHGEGELGRNSMINFGR